MKHFSIPRRAVLIPVAVFLFCIQFFPPTAYAADSCESLKETLKANIDSPNSQIFQDTESTYFHSCLADQGPVISGECTQLYLTLKSYAGFTDSMNKAVFDKAKADYLSKCLGVTSDVSGGGGLGESQVCADLRKQTIDYFRSTPEESGNPYQAEWETSCGENLSPARVFDPMIDCTNFHSPFGDVTLDSTEGKAVCELYRRGIIGGYSDGTFKGTQYVNRAEAAKFLLLACMKPTTTTNSLILPPDVVAGSWYEGYIRVAMELGIMTGDPQGTFRPADNVNRAEFLKMYTKACALPERAKFTDLEDVKSTDWYAQYAGITLLYHMFSDTDASHFLYPERTLTRNDLSLAIYNYLLNRNTPGGVQ